MVCTAQDASLEGLVLSRLGLICNRGGKYSKAVSLFKATLRTVARASASSTSSAPPAQGRQAPHAAAARGSHSETTTCLLALQGLTLAYSKLGQPSMVSLQTSSLSIDKRLSQCYG